MRYRLMHKGEFLTDWEERPAYQVNARRAQIARDNELPIHEVVVATSNAVDPPSMDWAKDRLIAHAEEAGIAVSTSATKTDILEAIIEGSA